MQIHLAVADQKRGPFSLEEINEQIASGALIAEGTSAWYEGRTTWEPLASVPGVSVPPPLPPPPTSLPASAVPPPGVPLLPRGQQAFRSPAAKPFRPAPPAEFTPAPSRSGRGDATGGIIPYKNPHARTAYYLGIVGLFPVLGIFLAIPAVVLGISGLKKRKRHPAIKGSVHAWIGIVLGLLSTGYNSLFILFIVLGLLFAPANP